MNEDTDFGWGVVINFKKRKSCNSTRVCICCLNLYSYPFKSTEALKTKRSVIINKYLRFSIRKHNNNLTTSIHCCINLSFVDVINVASSKSASSRDQL